MFRRVGPAVFVQAPAGCEPQRRRRTICAAQSGAARKRGRRRRRPERGRERLEYREEGQCRGKRASALPGTTARGNRDRNVPQAKNDPFLPSWHPVPGPAAYDRRREDRVTIKIKTTRSVVSAARATGAQGASPKRSKAGFGEARRQSRRRLPLLGQPMRPQPEAY